MKPVGDPVTLENAAISLEAVRTELERAGQFGEAQALAGLEIHNAAGAQVALSELSAVASNAPGVQAAIAEAINVCLLAAYPVVAAA